MNNETQPRGVQTDENVTEVIRLQKIIDELPEHNGEDPGHKRREYSLTKGDVILIYKIAKVAAVPHTCPFSGDESITLQSAARHIRKTEKIAAVVIVTSLVAGMVSGIWYLIINFIKQFVANGGVLK